MMICSSKTVWYDVEVVVWSLARDRHSCSTVPYQRKSHLTLPSTLYRQVKPYLRTVCSIAGEAWSLVGSG